MALPPSHLSSVMLLLALVMVSSWVSPTFLSRALVEKGFRINLRHIDSHKNYTKLELLQRGIHWLARLKSLACTTSGDSVQALVHSSSGEFLMNIAIGTPPKPCLAIMDTGSDLIWTQCKPCVRCFKQPTPIFDPSQSSSFSSISCSSKLCKAITDPVCDNGCGYEYHYADYSSTQGVIASETFTFGKVSVPNVGFGCSNDNDDETGGLTEGAGVVELGRGLLSLVSQY